MRSRRFEYISIRSAGAHHPLMVKGPMTLSVIVLYLLTNTVGKEV